MSINPLIFIVHGQGLGTNEYSAFPAERAPAADLKRKTGDLGKCRISLTGGKPLNFTFLRLPTSLSTMQLATCRRPERDSDEASGLRLSMCLPDSRVS
jgi:hypothetical protein